MNLDDIGAQVRHFSDLIDKGIGAIRDETARYAEAERDYRKAKAEAWVIARAEHPEMLAKEREAWVDAQTADARYLRDLAEGVRQAALEAVRSRRGQLSACQTLANAHIEEAKFERTAP